MNDIDEAIIVLVDSVVDQMDLDRIEADATRLEITIEELLHRVSVEVQARLTDAPPESKVFCMHCGVLRVNCHPGWPFFHICPFNSTEGGHRWVIDA